MAAMRQTATFLETLLRASADGIVITDTAQNVIVLNEAFCSFFGKTYSDVAEASLLLWLEQLDAGAVQRWAELERRVRLEGESRDVEFQKTTKDRARHLSVNASLMGRAGDGKSGAIISIWRDITTRKQAENALRDNEERYRAVFEQAADSIVLVDAQSGALVEFNDRAHENLGYTREEFETLTIADFEVLESAEEVVEHTAKIVREGADAFETKHRTKNGEIRNILVSVRAIPIRGRRLIQSIFRDITERRRAAEAREKLIGELREANENIKTLRGIVPICAHCKKIRDDEGYWHQVERYVSTHSEAEFTHGFCPQCIKELYPDCVPPEPERRTGRAHQHRGPLSEGFSRGKLEATRQTVRFLETLLGASADGIVVTDAAQNIIVANGAFCSVFGRTCPDVVETSLHLWLEQLDAGAVQRWAELEKRVRVEGRSQGVEFQKTTQDRARHLSVNASLMEHVGDGNGGAIISLWRDITPRKQAEEAPRRDSRQAGAPGRGGV